MIIVPVLKVDQGSNSLLILRPGISYWIYPGISIYTWHDFYLGYMGRHFSYEGLDCRPNAGLDYETPWARSILKNCNLQRAKTKASLNIHCIFFFRSPPARHDPSLSLHYRSVWFKKRNKGIHLPLFLIQNFEFKFLPYF